MRILDILLERNSKREGSARVSDDVVKKLVQELGGKQHKFYKPKIEIFKQNTQLSNSGIEPPSWIDDVEEAVIIDLDGTLALINGRSPYDATDCDIKDLPNPPVVKTVKLYF